MTKSKGKISNIIRYYYPKYYTRASPRRGLWAVMATASMQEILAVDCLSQAVVVLDEGGDEFMQAGLKNFPCRCVREPRHHLMRLSLRRAGAAIGAADRVE